MVKITVDTQHDSAQALRRVIAFIEEELRHRGEGYTPLNPIQVDEGNPFGSMFGSDTNSDNNSSQESSPQGSATAPDMFSVFSHDAPSQSEPVSTPPMDGYDTPTASRLLTEDEVMDNSNKIHHTQSLAEDVLRTGSTRKPERPFKIEPYE